MHQGPQKFYRKEKLTMPNYRLTLMQNLPSRDPSAFQVTYTYYNAPPQQWFVHNAGGNDKNTAVLVVNTGVNLIQQNVASRTLKAYYPMAPTEVDISISSVQPG
jgi:hypothetical protein